MNNINFDSKKALHYEEYAQKAVFGYEQLFTMALSLVSSKGQEAANVLVVGSGTGMELITFGRLMPNWQLTGVDPSIEMINISRSKIENHELSNRVTLHHGFVEELPEEEKYDSATLIFVMRFISEDAEKLSLLKDIARRLKPEAKLIIVDQYGDPRQEHFQTMAKAWRNFMKFGGLPCEIAINIAVQAFEYSFFTESEIQKLLSEAGFEKPNRFYNSFMHGGWVAKKNKLRNTNEVI